MESSSKKITSLKKKYIILTTGIYDMGGAEMYTNNKVKYLKSHGWETDVFYTQKGFHILLEELKRYEDNYIPELRYGFKLVPTHLRNNIINRILKDVSPDTTVIVEGHMINLCFWGELIAKKANGRNILNAMEENIVLNKREEIRFIEYKLK